MPTPYVFEFFAMLAPADKVAFERASHQMAVKKRETVIDQGTKARDVYFVLDGEFDVKLFSENGKDVPYGTLGPGGVFGELAAIDDGPRSATVVAKTDGRIVRLSGDHFRALAQSSPQAAMWLMRKYASQVRLLTRRLFEQIAYNVSTRIRWELLRLATSAGVKENQALIFPLPTHLSLANELGTTREAVTRELSHLAGLGLVKAKPRSRELRILDIEALTQLAQTGDEKQG